jgi:hypothetical protein
MKQIKIPFSLEKYNKGRYSVIGYMFAFIMLIYNESKYSSLTKFSLFTNIIISLSSWLIVICEFPETIKNIIK